MIDASASETDPECLFCRIANRELEADIVGANEVVVAFNDIAPRAPTHVLIVPRRHIADAAAIDDDDGALLAEMVRMANVIARDRGHAAGGYRLVFNVGDDAGNTVSHLHLHLLGGRQFTWPPG